MNVIPDIINDTVFKLNHVTYQLNYVHATCIINLHHTPIPPKKNGQTDEHCQMCYCNVMLRPITLFSVAINFVITATESGYAMLKHVNIFID